MCKNRIFIIVYAMEMSLVDQIAWGLTRSLLRSTTLSASQRGFILFSPSLWLAIERVDQRSVVGVSQIGDILATNEQVNY